MFIPHAGRRLATTVASLLAVSACATNPATGERQLSLISESQEVAMGRQAAAELSRSMGFVDDEALQSYVTGIGQRQAASSERPDLPWQFRVVDDPTPNAFALPGGFIYVTRGILNLMTSEAQLAGVLGHEIGHVTARHSVNQISKQQLAQLGLGLGSALFRPVGALSQVLGGGLELLFLKYSRDDEREADMLGFEYMRKQGYAVSEFDDVFTALQRSAEASEQSPLPGWLATHPAEEDRVRRAQERAAAVGPQPNAIVGREPFLRRVDNLVYGPDPRDGFFRDGTFYHPRLRFAISFPQGWRTQNLTQAVVAAQPDQAAIMQLTIADAPDSTRAMNQFLSRPDVAALRTQRTTIHGHTAAVADFRAQGEQAVIEGTIAFIDFRDAVYVILGYGAAGNFGRFAPAVGSAIASFTEVSDRSVLDVQPKRVDIVEVRSGLTLGEFVERYDSTVGAGPLAIINQVDGPQSRLEAGQLVKRVVG